MKNQTLILPRSNSKLSQNEYKFLFHSFIHSNFYCIATMCHSSQYLLLFLVAKTSSLPVRNVQPRRTRTAVHTEWYMRHSSWGNQRRLSDKIWIMGRIWLVKSKDRLFPGQKSARAEERRWAITELFLDTDYRILSNKSHLESPSLRVS